MPGALILLVLAGLALAYVLDVPGRLVKGLLAALWLLAIIGHLLLPAGHPVHEPSDPRSGLEPRRSCGEPERRAL